MFFSIAYASENHVAVVSGGKFIINVKSSELKYTEKKLDKFTLRQYLPSLDSEIEDNFLPYKNIILAVPPGAKPTFKITNLLEKVYENTIPVKDLSKIELQNIDISLLKKNITQNKIEIAGYFWLREYYCVEIKINTHEFDPVETRLKEIMEINIEADLGSYNLSDEMPIQIISHYDRILADIIYNSNIAGQFKAVNTDASAEYNDSWINFGDTYLKLGVGEDGIYRISYDDFINFDIEPSSFNPQTLKLIYKGNELPLFVEGESDGIFDRNDYLEFYGGKNYNKTSHSIINNNSEPYNQFLEMYSDTSIYWLTWGGTNGKRIQLASESNFTIKDTLNYYKRIDHYEENNFLDYYDGDIVSGQNPEWQKNETWFWNRIDSPSKVSKNFYITDLYPGYSAKIFYKVYSFNSNIAQNAHAFSLQINSSPISYDSSAINRYEQKLLKAEPGSDILLNGENKVHLNIYNTGASINMLAIDWFDVEYYRYLNLSENKLNIEIGNVENNKKYLFNIGAINHGEYIIYKIGDTFEKIISYKIKNSNLFFSDTVNNGDKYFISNQSEIRKPKFIYTKTFADLTGSSLQADYVLITHPLFIGKAEEYADFISESYSINTKVINVFDIYDQFNYGFFSPAPIKEFLYRAFMNWQSPKISYVFLVGEANYDYKNYRKLENYRPNFVPSYGHPVSDNWFAIWDSLIPVPQLVVGRLAILNIEEFQHYFDKHKKYVNDDYDLWNKSYLLLSGGLSESDQIFTKGVNNKVNEQIINPPTAGYSGHLYATTNPYSNFGPFGDEYIDSLFSAGAVAVSYIGHSGTKIWDNGIEDVSRLNNVVNKSSFVTDFGCSTGKFAEPDIVSFSEAFTNEIEGSAIGYIGNSSLGFTSTTNIFPELFYAHLLQSFGDVGMSHIKAKSSLFQNYGNSTVSKVFSYTNTLFADPVLKLNIPEKPNLIIRGDDIKLPDFLDDNLDSIEVMINYANYGKATADSSTIKIYDYYNGEINNSLELRRKLPLNYDNFIIKIPVKNLAGKHSFEIILDYMYEIDELYEDDNAVKIEYNISTSSLRSLLFDKIKNSGPGIFRILNSVQKGNSNKIIVEIDNSPSFNSPQMFEYDFDTVITEIKLTGLKQKNRYWLRTKNDESFSDYFETLSFIYDSLNTYYYSLSDSISFSELLNENFVNTDEGVKLGQSVLTLKLSSDGVSDGGIAKVEYDGVDFADNPRGCGHQIIIIDSQTLKYEGSRWFNIFADADFHNYITFLDTLSADKYIAVALSNFCGGAGVNAELIEKLKLFGSTKIDSVNWNTSWVFLGKKGAAQGTMPESFSKTGTANTEVTFNKKIEEGEISSNIFEPQFELNKIIVTTNERQTDGLFITPVLLGVKPDSLERISIINEIDLRFLNEYDVRAKKIILGIDGSKASDSLLIKSINFSLVFPPELAVNYQVVSISKDSLNVGENVELNFDIYNVGETSADSFYVDVDLANENNTSQTNVFRELVTSIDSLNKKSFNLNYNTAGLSSEYKFNIKIDNEEKITELFKDNNFYSIPFYVKPDTTKPALNLTFDGKDIFDGEYISPKPNIKVELTDISLLPVTDTSSVKLYLDDAPVYYSNNNQISYKTSASNPKYVVEFTPTLSDGEHTISVFAKDASGNFAEQNGLSKSFIVSNQVKLLDLYNYPNPFSSETYFTFKLTQIPDEVRIKVFTIAGRLVKEIRKTSAELNFDFNKIYWDGRDEDGDLLGNGVYIYRAIIKASGISEDITQKLAIIR